MATEGERTSAMLDHLQEKGDTFSRQIVVEKKRAAELSDAIGYVDSQIDQYREMSKKAAIEVMNLHILTPNPAYQRADGVNIAREAESLQGKVLSILEIKLNKLNQRNSELENRNAKLKKDVDHMRKRRVQTDRAFRISEASLRKLKVEIEEIMAKATEMREARQELIEQRAEVIQQSKEEHEKFEQEYEEMGEYIRSQNMALEEELFQERVQAARDSKETTFEVTPTVRPEESSMAGRVEELTSYLNAEHSSLATVEQKIETYEEMFSKLRVIAGVDDMAQVIASYAQHEEEMFSLYNYIQTQNTELEWVLESRAKLEAAIAQFQEAQEDMEKRRKETIQSLQQKLTSTVENKEALRDQAAVEAENVEKVAKKVQSLFFKLQCDQIVNDGAKSTAQKGKAAKNKGGQVKPAGAVGRAVESKLTMLTGQGVNESNLMDYMAIVEARAVDIITEYLRKQARSRDAFGQVTPTPGPSTPAGMTMEQLKIPDISEDVADADEERNDAEPVDLEDFKAQLQLRLQQGAMTAKELLRANSTAGATEDTTSPRAGAAPQLPGMA